ncbi:MAG: TolC family protein [Anaerovoracaceae bacterium]
MKKLVSVLAAVSLIVSQSIVSFGADLGDIKGVEGEKAIIFLSEKGIVTGSEDELYHPEKNLTRAEACAIIIRAVNPKDLNFYGSETVTESLFDDLSGYTWSSSYINYAVLHGITKGTGWKSFSPGRNVTSAELITFVLRAAGHTDDDFQEPWPENYLQQAVKLGILTGEDISDLPVYASKGFAAEVVYRAFSFIENIELARVENPFNTVEAEDPGVSSLIFTGNEIEISLSNLMDIAMTSGTAIKKAENNLRANKGKTKGYYESQGNLDNLMNQIKDAKTALSTAVGAEKIALEAFLWSADSPSKTQMKMVEEATNFAESQTDKNYEAEVNLIRRAVIQDYFQLAGQKEGVRISKDNMEIQKQLYDVAKKKYALGVASKLDVLKAETGFAQAKSDYEKAETGYIVACMNFNISYGFPLMQSVILTDSLEEAKKSDVTLSEAIKRALENRNEIAFAEFYKTSATLNFTQVKSRIGKGASSYIAAESNVFSAENDAKLAPLQVEMDIRAKYLDMLQKKGALEASALAKNNGTEAYRLAKLQYDAGIISITEVQLAQIASYTAQLAYVESLLAYNLSILDYEQAMTSGTFSAPL